MKRWKKEETEKLIKLYNKLDNEELLKHFDRSYTAIYKKARKLGLCLSPEMKFNNRSKARREMFKNKELENVINE